MRNNSTKKLVMAGICIGLSQVLSYIKLFEAPQKGSVTAGSMVPIILFALVYGLKDGLLAAVVYGILQFVLGGIISLHPLSIIIDYLLGFGVLGFAGLFGGEKNITKAIIGTLLASIMRFIMLFISGVLVWAAYTPEGMKPWFYSLTYNGSYMIPETIITVVIIGLIYNKVYDYMK